jgi:hypothetical protein
VAAEQQSHGSEWSIAFWSRHKFISEYFSENSVEESLDCLCCESPTLFSFSSLSGLSVIVPLLNLYSGCNHLW